MTFLGWDSLSMHFSAIYCMSLLAFAFGSFFFLCSTFLLSQVTLLWFALLASLLLSSYSIPSPFERHIGVISSLGAYSLRCVLFSWWLFSPSVSW